MKVEDESIEIQLRPRRIQAAADRAADTLMANLERVMDLTDAEREEYAEAIRALARGTHGSR